MSFKSRCSAALAAGASLVAAATAHAHVEISSGPGYAAQTQVITFAVAHGCSGADTEKITVHIPRELSSVRAVPSVFGEVEVQSDDTGTISAVAWTHSKVRPVDDSFYSLEIRAKFPDAPFTTIYVPVTQLCKDKDGKETTVEWAALPSDPVPVSGTANPAAKLAVLPVRVSGWNQYTVKDKLSDLTVFNDAQIVWSGNAAYSPSDAIRRLIAGEDGVTALDAIEAGATIWVKY